MPPDEKEREQPAKTSRRVSRAPAAAGVGALPHGPAVAGPTFATGTTTTSSTGAFSADERAFVEITGIVLAGVEGGASRFPFGVAGARASVGAKRRAAHVAKLRERREVGARFGKPRTLQEPEVKIGL